MVVTVFVTGRSYFLTRDATGVCYHLPKDATSVLLPANRCDRYTRCFLNDVTDLLSVLVYYLLGLQVTDDGVDVAQDLVYEGHHLAHLHLHKVAPALLCDLDEGVARHVLHAIVGLCGQEEPKTLTLVFCAVQL